MCSTNIWQSVILLCRKLKPSTSTAGGCNIILHSLQLQRYVADMRQMIAEAHSKMDMSVSDNSVVSLTSQPFLCAGAGKKPLVTVAHFSWTLLECWQHQSNCFAQSVTTNILYFTFCEISMKNDIAAVAPAHKNGWLTRLQCGIHHPLWFFVCNSDHSNWQWSVN